MKSKYEISICWSDEDDAYIASVADLPGCMADGASYQEALAAAERAIELWIQTARELGRDIPQPRAPGLSLAPIRPHLFGPDLMRLMERDRWVHVRTRGSHRQFQPGLTPSSAIRSAFPVVGARAQCMTATINTRSGSSM